MIALALLLLVQGTRGAAVEIAGDWVNERRTAIIRIADCPSDLCGTVVWSTAAAQRDAARGGKGELNGTTVMFGFIPASPNHWRGKLYLPHHDRTVKAIVELRADSALDVRGCELGGIICKSQKWTRWAAKWIKHSSDGESTSSSPDLPDPSKADVR